MTDNFELSSEQKQFINEYSKVILHKEAALFIGSGVSISVGYPSWDDLFRQCIADIGIAPNFGIDIPTAVQYYVNLHGRSALDREVRKKISIEKSTNPSIGSLIRNFIDDIWTTNYDDAVEQDLRNHGIAFNLIHTEDNLSECVNTKNKKIYKLAGDRNNLSKALITKDDFERFDSTHKTFIDFLTRDLIVKRFLFVGYSFQDGIATKRLCNIHKILGDSSNKHYAILKKTNETLDLHVKKDLEKRYNLNIVWVDSYDEIYRLIDELCFKIKSRRIFISGSVDNPDPTTEKHIMIFTEKLIKRLFDADYYISTGMGKTIGPILSGNALQYISNRYDFESNHLEMVPYPFSGQNLDELRNNHRSNIIDSVNFVLFIYGVEREQNNGVYKEFQVAKSKGKYIIPLGGTGGASKQIYDEIKSEQSKYGYLDRYMQNLGLKMDENNIDTLINTIFSIINESNLK